MENRTMDLNEKWVRLGQDIIPEGSFVVTNLIQSSKGTKVILDDEEHVVEVFFDGIPVLVRSSIESIRMRTWGEIQQKYHDKFFFRNWFYFHVENSKLSEWMKEESCGFFEERQLKHFAIVTSEEIIDILATFEPDVKVTKL